jgi:hypothetical protein
MFFGVLEMPYELAMSDELSRRQFYSRVQEAVARLRELEASRPAPAQAAQPQIEEAMCALQYASDMLNAIAVRVPVTVAGAGDEVLRVETITKASKVAERAYTRLARSIEVIEGALLAQTPAAKEGVASPDDGGLEDRKRAYTRGHADGFAQGQREVVAPGAAPRGTDAQILKERELTASAIRGAMAFGYQGVNPPPESDHWLAEFWEIGRKQRELERPSEAAGAAQPVATGEDAITLAFRLYGEDPDTFAPETRAVMDKLRPTLDAILGGAPYEAAMLTPVAESHSGQLRWLVPDEEQPANCKLYTTAALNREVEPRTVRMPLKEEQMSAVFPPLSSFLRESLYDYEQAHVMKFAIQCGRAVEIAHGIEEPKP